MLQKYLLKEQIFIQEAALADAPSIAALQIKMAKETEDFDLSPEVVNQGVIALLQDPHKGIYYTFTTDLGEIVGCVLITKEWSDWRNGTILWIQSLYLKTELRGNGIFSEVYRFFQKQVQTSEDLCGIRLYVDKSNQKAVKVYQAIGMNNQHYEMFEWIPSQQ